MKEFKLFILSCFAIICVALFGSVFTSCSNDDDLFLADDSQTGQVFSHSADSLKSMTRGGSTSTIGTSNLNNDVLVIDNHDVCYITFTPSPSYSAMLTNANIDVYVKLTKAGAGWSSWITMTKGSLNFSCYFDPYNSGYSAGRYIVSFYFSTTPGGTKYSTGNNSENIIVTSNSDNYSSLCWYHQTIDGVNYDQRGFAMLNCTSWVAGKINELWGTSSDFYNSMTSPALSHAKFWKDRLVAAGYSADQTNPQAGDIIWWPASGNGSLKNGHVGYVYKVTSSTIYYTDYNHTGNGEFGARTLNNNSSSIGTKWFIHMQIQWCICLFT